MKNEDTQYYLEITVFSNRRCESSKKPIFVRLLYMQSLDDVPYSRIGTVLRYLFGRSAVVVFRLGLTEDIYVKD